MKKKFLPLILAAATTVSVCLAGCGGIKPVAEKSPTCTEAGNVAYYTDGTKFYSDAEGKTEITEADYVLNALGHDWGTPAFAWTGYTAATATFTCTRDGSHTTTETAVITSQTTPATCKDGQTVYTAKVTLGGKDYTEVKTEVLTATEAHKPEADFSKDGEKHWKECSVCHGHIDETAHVFVWKTEGKFKHEECECGAKRNENTPVAPDNELTLVPYKAPTCGEDGNEAYYTDGEKYYSDALGEHEITDKTSVILTATGEHNVSSSYVAENSDADNHWKVCSVCKTHVESAAHSFDWVIDKQPSETETGLKHEECTVCHKTRNENTVIPSTGPSKVITPVSANEPDCTTAGNIAYFTDGEKYYSDAAGEHEITLESTVRPALGHDWSAPVTPEFTWTGYSAATAKFTCKRAGCGHYENVNAIITSQTTPATCGAAGETVYTATATFNDAPYTDTKTEVLPATGLHGAQICVYEPSETAGENGKFYRQCSVCGGDKWEVGVYGDRAVTVNGTNFSSPYACYTEENIGKGVTYDAINQLFVIHLSGTAEALTIAGNNNEVAISVDEDTTIPSITFTNGFRQLFIKGEGKLTVTGKFKSEASLTTIDCDVEFNGGVETLTQQLLIRSGNVVVNGTLSSSACVITVGTADGSTAPVFTVNSTAGQGGLIDGDWGRAFNLHFLSGTVNINQTSESKAEDGILCKTADSKVVIGAHATVNINGFNNGFAAWGEGVVNVASVTIESGATLNIDCANDYRDMAVTDNRNNQ